MDRQFRRSWTLIMHAAGKLRDFGAALSGGSMDSLTIGQERVLQVVFQNSPDGVKLKEIAKQVKLTPGAVSQIIESLVQMGMVERSSDASDRRAVNIHITSKCEGIRNQVVGFFDEAMETVLAKKTPEECAAFIDILEKIIAKTAFTSESTRRYAGETLLAMEEFK